MEDSENIGNTATIPVQCDCLTPFSPSCTAGYLSKLKYNESEMVTFISTSPQKSRRGVLYQTITIPKKKNRTVFLPSRFCALCLGKHFRLLQLQIGAGIVEVAS